MSPAIRRRSSSCALNRCDNNRSRSASEPAQLFESRVELHRAFDHGRLQRQVLHHQLVLQSLDLPELAPVVIEQPRVVQPHRGVRRELLDRSRPSNRRSCPRDRPLRPRGRPAGTLPRGTTARPGGSVRRGSRQRGVVRARGRARRTTWVEREVSARSTTRSIPEAIGPSFVPLDARSARSSTGEASTRLRSISNVSCKPSRRMPGISSARSEAPSAATVAVSEDMSARFLRRFRSFTADRAAVAIVTPHNVAIVMTHAPFGAGDPPNIVGDAASVPELTPLTTTSEEQTNPRPPPSTPCGTRRAGRWRSRARR